MEKSEILSRFKKEDKPKAKIHTTINCKKKTGDPTTGTSSRINQRKMIDQYK
jgi:hypothetical protein